MWRSKISAPIPGVKPSRHLVLSADNQISHCGEVPGDLDTTSFRRLLKNDRGDIPNLLDESSTSVVSSASSNEYKSLMNRNKALIQKMSQVDRARIERLRRAAKVGEVIFTKQGIFESTVCSACNYHHKLTSILNSRSPCPATECGRKYYSENASEKKSIESFPLNKLLKAKPSRQNDVPTSTTGNLPVSEDKKKLPKLTPFQENPDSSNLDHRIAGNRCRPKTAGPKLERVKITKSSEEFRHARSKTPSVSSSSSFRVENIESSTSESFSDNFPRDGVLPHCSVSDWSDLDKTEDEMEEMKRQLYREMFLQEEEALRLRLGRDRDRYKLRLKCLKTLDTEAAQDSLRRKRSLENLQRQLYDLMEEEIILGVVKVSLNDEYQQKQAQHRESVRQKSKEITYQRKLLREIGKECAMEPTTKQQQLKKNYRRKLHRSTPRNYSETTTTASYPLKHADSGRKDGANSTPLIERTVRQSPRPASAHHSRRPIKKGTFGIGRKRISFEVAPKDDIEMPSELSELSELTPLSSSDSSIFFTDTKLKSKSISTDSSVPLMIPRVISPLTVIEETKRQSSIVGHVDSLILIPKQLNDDTVPQLQLEGRDIAPDSASSPVQEYVTSSCDGMSQDVVTETKRQSSIVEHVDSLILMEQSKQINDAFERNSEASSDSSSQPLDAVSSSLVAGGNGLVAPPSTPTELQPAVPEHIVLAYTGRGRSLSAPEEALRHVLNNLKENTDVARNENASLLPGFPTSSTEKELPEGSSRITRTNPTRKTGDEVASPGLYFAFNGRESSLSAPEESLRRVLDSFKETTNPSMGSGDEPSFSWSSNPRKEQLMMKPIIIDNEYYTTTTGKRLSITEIEESLKHLLYNNMGKIPKKISLPGIEIFLKHLKNAILTGEEISTDESSREVLDFFLNVLNDKVIHRSVEAEVYFPSGYYTTSTGKELTISDIEESLKHLVSGSVAFSQAKKNKEPSKEDIMEDDQTSKPSTSYTPCTMDSKGEWHPQSEADTLSREADPASCNSAVTEKGNASLESAVNENVIEHNNETDVTTTSSSISKETMSNAGQYQVKEKVTDLTHDYTVPQDVTQEYTPKEESTSDSPIDHYESKEEAMGCVSPSDHQSREESTPVDQQDQPMEEEVTSPPEHNPPQHREDVDQQDPPKEDASPPDRTPSSRRDRERRHRRTKEKHTDKVSTNNNLADPRRERRPRGRHRVKGRDNGPTQKKREHKSSKHRRDRHKNKSSTDSNDDDDEKEDSILETGQHLVNEIMVNDPHKETVDKTIDELFSMVCPEDTNEYNSLDRSEIPTIQVSVCGSDPSSISNRAHKMVRKVLKSARKRSKDVAHSSGGSRSGGSDAGGGSDASKDSAVMSEESASVSTRTTFVKDMLRSSNSPWIDSYSSDDDRTSWRPEKYGFKRSRSNEDGNTMYMMMKAFSEPTHTNSFLSQRKMITHRRSSIF